MGVEDRKQFRVPIERPYGTQVEINRSNESGAVLERVKGSISDLSSGGLMVLLGAAVNSQDYLTILFRFPGLLEKQRLLIQVVWASGPGSHKIVGAKFVQVPETLAGLLKKLTGDYQECEKRIETHQPDLCRRDCAYWSICLKTIKIDDGSPSETPTEPSDEGEKDIQYRNPDRLS